MCRIFYQYIANNKVSPSLNQGFQCQYAVKFRCKSVLKVLQSLYKATQQSTPASKQNWLVLIEKSNKNLYILCFFLSQKYIAIPFIHVLTHHPYCICSRKSDFLRLFLRCPIGRRQLSEIVMSLTIVQMSLCCDDGGWRLESLMLMGIRQASEESALSSGFRMKR